MKLKNILAPVLMGVFALQAALVSGQDLPQPSPIAKTEQRIGLTDFTVVYSRPSVKDREIFGKLVPYNELWRTGANANTLFTTSDDVKIGGVDVKAGTYSFFTIPGEKEWEIIFNSVTDAWGDGKYDAKNNVASFKVKAEMTSFTESMEIGFDKVNGSDGVMYLRWAKVQVSIPIAVDVEAKAMANIKAAIAEAPEDSKVLRNAANYLMDSGKNLDQALTYINKSIEIKDYWYSHWVKADVLAAMGNYKEAIKSAEDAIKMGEAGAKESGKPFKYKGELEKEIASWKGKK